MRNEQAIIIRAQQLRDQYDGTVAVREIAEKLVAEMPDAAVSAIEQFLAKTAAKPHLPEPADQGSLFKVKQWARVDGPDGPMYVEGDAMLTAEVKGMLRDVKRSAQGQVFRATRALADCETLESWKGFDPELPHNENVERYQHVLDAADDA